MLDTLGVGDRATLYALPNGQLSYAGVPRGDHRRPRSPHRVLVVPVQRLRRGLEPGAGGLGRDGLLQPQDHHLRPDGQRLHRPRPLGVHRHAIDGVTVSTITRPLQEPRRLHRRHRRRRPLTEPAICSSGTPRSRSDAAIPSVYFPPVRTLAGSGMPPPKPYPASSTLTGSSPVPASAMVTSSSSWHPGSGSLRPARWATSPWLDAM